MGRTEWLLCIAWLAVTSTQAQVSFRDSPASATALTNFPTSVSCTANQPTPAAISWEKDAVELTMADDNRLSISYDSSTGRSQLRIDSVSYRDAGEYVCVATDSESSRTVSSAGTITVQGIPAFATPLLHVTVTLGGQARLECQVLSNPPAIVSWFFEQSGSSVRRPLSTGGRVSVSSNVLTIINVQAEDAGYYVCSAQNPFGTNMTSARLQVGAPIGPFDVTITPSDQDPLQVRAGGSVTLRCTVPSGTPISSITWSRSAGGSLATSVTQLENGLLLALSSISSTDTDDYTCTALDVSGNRVSQSIAVQVLVPPRFTQVPENISGVAGSTPKVQLACVATGDPPPTITWLSPALTLLPAAPQFDPIRTIDAGTYTCVATNSAAEIRTQFTVVVEGIPVISIEPPVLTVAPGQDIEFHCSAVGTPPPVPVWSRSGGSLPAGSVSATGSDSNSVSLHLFGVSSNDAGTYTCSAGNIHGLRTAQATLTVLANPRITMTTASPVVILTPSQLSLACASSAPPQATLRWFLNDTLLDPSQDSNVLVGADGSLNLRTTTISNTGIYTCNVSTSFTSVVARIQVIVGVMPVIQTPPSDVDLGLGASAVLACLGSGFPHPHTIWRKTDPVSQQTQQLGVVGPSHIQLSSGLQLRNVSGNDTGVYECTIQNAIGSVMQPATVRVEAPPLATSIGPNTTVSNNTMATLICDTPLNFPPADISWSVPNTEHLPETYSVSESGELTISSVTLDDAQPITCTATNHFGQSSITRAITVLYPPTVSVSSPALDVLLDGSVILLCDTEGEPTPDLSWVLPDGTMAGSKGGMLTAEGGLPLTSVIPENGGTYTCIGTNALGSSNGNITVTIRGAQIEGLSIVVESTTELRVEWDRPMFAIISRLSAFEVTVVRVTGRVLVTTQSISTIQGSSSFLVTELSPGVAYEVTLRGLYRADVLGINSTAIATTRESFPTGAPMDFVVTPIANGLFLQWSLPAEEQRNGVITSYNLEYRLVLSGLMRQNFMENILTNSSIQERVTHLLPDLQAGDTYEVLVAAVNSAGNGPLTLPITAVILSGGFDDQVALSIAIGVGVALLAIGLVVAIVLGVYLAVLLYRRKTRAGKHDPLLAQERDQKIDRKERKKKTVSGPIAGITPQVDYSVHGKFTVQGENGNVLNLKPKVITNDDVAPPPPKGGRVQVVGRQQTVLATSEEDDERYVAPADALKHPRGVPLRQKSPQQQVPLRHKSPQQRVQQPQKPSGSPRVAKQVSSGMSSSDVYSEVSDVMKTPPTSAAKGRGQPLEATVEDKPYEEVQYDENEDGDMLGRTTDSPPSPEQPEIEDDGTDESHLLYASVSHDHVEKKRERRLEEERKQRVMQQRQQEQEMESKEQRKMREKMERETKKMEEKERKKREKEEENERKRKEKEEKEERKRMEAEKKKRAKDQKLRESMGLSNIVGYQDIDFSKPGARAQAEFIDTATASLF